MTRGVKQINDIALLNCTLIAVGCPTPKYPKQGYLVHGNASHAEFMCCVDHVFPDTGKRFRNLTCQEGYRWSEDLPDCVGNDKTQQF